jgi:hypothetical protein
MSDTFYTAKSKADWAKWPSVEILYIEEWKPGVKRVHCRDVRWEPQFYMVYCSDEFLPETESREC